MLVAPPAHLPHPVVGPPAHLMIGSEHDHLAAVRARARDVRGHARRGDVDRVRQRVQPAHAPVSTAARRRRILIDTLMSTAARRIVVMTADIVVRIIEGGVPHARGASHSWHRLASHLAHARIAALLHHARHQRVRPAAI